MTKQEFINFIDNLKLDFIENKEQWENKTIEDYLDAMSNYIDDIDGYYTNTNQDIDLNSVNWKVFADILKGSSIYE
jgi:DNA-binding protein Fis